MIHYGPQDARQLHVYQYHFLDDLSFIREPAGVFSDTPPDDLELLVRAVRDRLLSAGWEGDGNLGVIWLPPFADVGIEDTWGTYIWHVKQANNGTSWLASRYPLDFDRLEEQNEMLPWKTHKPVSIVYTACRTLKQNADALVSGLDRKLRALNPLPDPEASEIRDELLLVTQGALVAELQEFLDWCHLQMLTEVFQNGNPSRLRIGAFRARLNPTHYVPLDEEEPTTDVGDEAASWFTTKGLIRDIWWSYKYESFKEKVGMLFRACDYKIGEDLQREMLKHAILRNCVQHQQRRLTADALREAGTEVLTLLGNDGTITNLGAWERISFTLEELKVFSHSLGRLAADFDEHVRTRVRSVAWVPAAEAEAI